MILRKIIKTVATRCRISRIKCTKFDFGWGFAIDPTGELTALPRHLARFTLHCINYYLKCPKSLGPLEHYMSNIFKGPTSTETEGKADEWKRW